MKKKKLKLTVKRVLEDLSEYTAIHKTEKERRMYYQNIVYDVCNLIDRKLGNKPGCGVVCGTLEEPNRNVQIKLKELLGA